MLRFIWIMVLMVACFSSMPLEVADTDIEPISVDTEVRDLLDDVVSKIDHGQREFDFCRQTEHACSVAIWFTEGACPARVLAQTWHKDLPQHYRSLTHMVVAGGAFGCRIDYVTVSPAD